MKVYESKIKDTITLRDNNQLKVIHVDTEWSYIISVSIWVPLSILYILILFLPDSIFTTIPSFIGNWLTRARIWDHQKLGLFKIYSLLTIGHWTVVLYNRLFRRSKRNGHFNAIESNYFPIKQTDGVPADDLQKMLDAIKNEFSLAYKYLCTCNGENKIFARKPIRMGDVIEISDNGNGDYNGNGNVNINIEVVEIIEQDSEIEIIE